MTPEKEATLLHLADHTDIMHLALEGTGISLDERLTYLGHLAMCARIFKSICLNESTDTTRQLARIEHLSFKIGTPGDERGSLVKESWSNFEPVLLSYIDMRVGT